MSKVKIVGLDPSMSNFGIANVTLDLDTMTFEVDKLTLVSTTNEKDKKLKKAVRKNSEDLDRGQILFKGMIDGTKHAWIAIAEVPVGSQSARAMASYGVCIGVLAGCPIPIIQVTPTEVKAAATGIKTATKEEMIEWGMAKYPHADWRLQSQNGPGFKKGDPKACNEHLADALAAIEAGLDTDQFQQIIAIMKGSLFNASGLTV